MERIFGFFWNLDTMFYLMCEAIFLQNVLFQIEYDDVPNNSIYQIKKWQYELCDILYCHYKN